MNAEELYKEFLRNFPDFEPMVKYHIMLDDNRLKIITKQHKSFIFEYRDGDIRLETVK